MTVTEESVYEFSQLCARIYCKQYSAWSQFDDATQDACLYLLNNQKKWTQPKPKLINRVIGELVRCYQKEHGLRRKSKLKRVDVNLSLIATKEEREVDDSRWSIVERALRQPDVAPNRSIVESLLEPDATVTTVAKKHGLTKARVSQIFKQFKAVCQRLHEDIPGVVLVDAHELNLTQEENEQMGLFFQ